MKKLLTSLNRRVNEIKNKRNYSQGQPIALKIETSTSEKGRHNIWLEHEGEEKFVGKIKKKLSRIIEEIEKKHNLETKATYKNEDISNATIKTYELKLRTKTVK
ncbi:MAG: hypothetical protein ACE5DI_05035 [Candidatus Micrarchaeia archaeon]